MRGEDGGKLLLCDPFEIPAEGLSLGVDGGGGVRGEDVGKLLLCDPSEIPAEAEGLSLELGVSKEVIEKHIGHITCHMTQPGGHMAATSAWFCMLSLQVCPVHQALSRLPWRKWKKVLKVEGCINLNTSTSTVLIPSSCSDPLPPVAKAHTAAESPLMRTSLARQLNEKMARSTFGARTSSFSRSSLEHGSMIMQAGELSV